MLFRGLMILSVWAVVAVAPWRVAADEPRNRIVVGSELDYPPYALVDENGQADGFSVDLMKAVCEVMGVTPEFRVGPWDEVRAALENGEIDALPLVSYSEEREKVFDFTVPHTTSRAAFFTRAGGTLDALDDLAGKRIAVLRSDAAHDYLVENGSPGTLVLTRTVAEALQAVASGKADIALAPRLPALLTISDLKLDGLRQVGPLLDVYGRGYGFAVREGDAALLAILNHGLRIVKETGRYDEIYTKWFGAIDPAVAPQGEIVKFLILAGIVLSMVLAIAMIWTQSLKRQVEQRTQELKEEVARHDETAAELRRHYATLVGLHEILADQTRSLDDKIAAILDLGIEMFGLPLAILSHIEGDDYTVEYARGPDWSPPPGAVFPFARTYCFHTLRANGPIGYHHAGKSDIAGHPCYQDFGLESYLAAPISVRGKTYGTLNFSSPDPHGGPFDDNDFALIRLFADWLGNELARRADDLAMAEQNERLARSNAELEQFAYVASHDLQEPLRMVASYAQLLARKYHGALDAEADEMIGFMVNGAKRMQALIIDLLAYSRVGSQDRPSSDVACDAVFDSVVATLGEMIKAAKAEVRRGDLPVLRADPLQMELLFQNLLTNALKYRDPARPLEIDVTAMREGEGWVLRFKDNGIGIDPIYFERIFVIFQRLHNQDQYSGSGVGLAICKKIVERHDGRIWLESEPGKGTTFIVSIPD